MKWYFNEWDIFPNAIYLYFKDLDTPQLHIVTDIKAYDVEKQT